jgi:hypothetical protein
MELHQVVVTDATIPANFFNLSQLTLTILLEILRKLEASEIRVLT